MIEILNYTPCNQGKKIGFVDVYIPKIGIIFRHLAHLQSGEKRWINFPTFAHDEGERKIFKPYTEFKQSTHNGDFLEQVNEALKNYCEKNNIGLPEKLDLSGKLEDMPF